MPHASLLCKRKADYNQEITIQPIPRLVYYVAPCALNELLSESAAASRSMGNMLIEKKKKESCVSFW